MLWAFYLEFVSHNVCYVSFGRCQAPNLAVVRVSGCLTSFELVLILNGFCVLLLQVLPSPKVLCVMPLLVTFRESKLGVFRLYPCRYAASHTTLFSLHVLSSFLNSFLLSASRFPILNNRHYRHWGCVTKKILENMKAQFETADELDGFDELQPADQDRLRKAWEEGHVADEDIPETARKPAGEDEGEEEEEKSKKKAPAKKKAAAEDGEEKPKKARAPRKVGIFVLTSFRRLSNLLRFRKKRTMAMRKKNQRRRLPLKSVLLRRLVFLQLCGIP
jgi:hypothetical protein